MSMIFLRFGIWSFCGLEMLFLNWKYLIYGKSFSFGKLFLSFLGRNVFKLKIIKYEKIYCFLFWFLNGMIFNKIWFFI